MSRGVTGNFQSNPRVFAHSARVVKIRSISQAIMDEGFNGVGYVVGQTYTTTSGGNGSNNEIATVKVTKINSSGGVLEFEIVNGGTGYTVGNTFLLPTQGGAVARMIITSLDLPGTHDTGAAIYCGAAQAELTVVMEDDEVAVFKNVAAGTFLPILVKRVAMYSSYTGPNNGGTNPNPGEILALY